MGFMTMKKRFVVLAAACASGKRGQVLILDLAESKVKT
jgi:hypothetical protein